MLCFLPKLKVSGLNINSTSTLEASAVQSFAHYEKSFQGRGFLGGGENLSGLAVLKTSINELVKDYRLKGTVILSEPEAIVEDARTQKTIFVKTGQQLGELKVKEVAEGKLVLAYYGEETVLLIE